MAEIISTGGKWKQMVEQLQIDRVIGLSPPSSGTVAHSPSHADILAYPAGSFAVVYNSSSRQQLRLLRSTTSNAQLGCIAWSASGEHVATGEAGSNSAILVWDWNSSKCLAELKAHKHSVACVRFSQTDGKLLLSAGGANDGMLCIWDWKAGSVLWRQNVAAELTSAVFTEDSSCVLALGKGIFKAWSVSSTSQAGAGRGKAAAAGSSSSLSLTPRPVTLRELQGSRFADVAVAPSPPQQPPGSNGVYALVATGVLVLMRPTGRVIDKSVNLQVRAAYALAAGATQVAAACAQGVVRLFSCKSLAFRATLPRFVARGQGPAAGAGAAAEEGFPDARACSFRPETEQQLVVVYADMSMIVWDIQDLKKITCLQTLAAHSSCIWDICPITAPVFSMAGLQQQQQQPSRCATCAADGTVRFWNLSADAPPGTGRLLPAAVDAQGRPSGQLRCMRISTDGRHICVGDQAGTLRVFDSVTLKLLLQQEAHDCEVLCLDYSPLMQGGSCLAASGSRDTLIHVFDVQAGYALLQTLDEHSAAVTGVRFTAGGKGLVSCGADRSIIFRVLGGDSSSAAYHIETLPHSMLFDLVVDPLDQYVFTTGQDGLLRQWDVATGSLQRTLAPEAGAGEPIKLYIDPGGVVLICCHADGCLRLYHLATGQLLWRAWGHSEMVAAASLSSDLTKMVSVGGDGCVIVWKLPEQLVQEVQAAVRRVAAAKLHLDAVGQQQQGQQVPGHLDGAPSARQMAWFASPAAAGASSPGIADSSPASNPGSSSTPLGTCPSSESGMASALLRVRQGKPLVSTDKLPKWARSPSSPISGSASPAASGSGQAQQQQPLFNRWFGGRQQPSKNKWLAAQKADDGGDGACRRLSLESKSSAHDGGSENQPGAPDAAGTLHQTSSGSGQLEPQQQHEDEDGQQMPGWPQDDDMVVIQDWDDSSLAQYDDALDAAAAAPPPAAGAADGAATHVTGGERVARDLFKEHFSSLGDAGPAPAPEGGSQRLRTQDLRQSLSAMFKAGRASLGGLLPLRSQPVSSAGGSSIPARNDTSSSEAYTCSTTAEAGAAASPLRVSTEGEEVHAAEKQAAAAVAAAGPPEVQPLLPPSSNGGLSAASSTSHLEDEQLPSGQASPKRRWRVGKMDAELAGMRERLASLQALYQQQMLQRQLSPRRGSQTGVSLEALTSRICEQYTETLLQKLEERRQQKKKQERTPSPTKQQRRQAQQQQRQKQHEQEQSAAST
ncbi:hypothetical protein OEZ85_008470 [Tetradesmus obliquus]|uniref:Anaphase-promoting complex subunit 4 WD40 domain-containing protein n=1 Tax=Tetradesmus obliquus TaxID=3088 RepID=A0ABY8TIX2_TETOB|nr:hypothetical protein OEZ85_008470 [Tetradesmus obliquus]